MVLDILLFLVGLVFVVKGADHLTDGASAVARRLNVSSLLIGLTIVALGTSLPEYVVSTISATKGNSDMSLGNVVGSNIFNTLAVVGVTALFCPVLCKGPLFKRDIPVNIFASLLVVTLLLSGDYIGLNRIEGAAMLVLFAGYMAFTIYQSHTTDAAMQADGQPAKAPMSVRGSWCYIILGLAELIIGGNWFVDGASGIATELGVSQSLIALTIVAMGTSLPELATSVIAARKGDTDMAMGNVVGSNIFNLLLIIGTSAVITPIRAQGIQTIDLMVMSASILLLTLLVLISPSRRINRYGGALLILCAIAYYVWLATA